MTAPTTRETADHAGLARLRQHIANLKLRPGHHVQFGTPSVSQISNYWNRDLADDLEALLSEIAALRGERDDYRLRTAELTGERDALKANLDGAREDDLRHLQQAAQAERQRDEAVGLLRKFNEAWRSGCGWLPAMNSLDDEIEAFLANQGAD